MFRKEVKYSYNDIAICPAVLSEVRHRNECNVMDYKGFLPIFASPMTTVINKDNYKTFEDNHIIPILPRSMNIPFSDRFTYASQGKWAAFSLEEFNKYFCNDEIINGTTPYKVLIDIANGHMTELYRLVKKAKKLHGDNIIVMVGNVANPKTYEECWRAGADYVRLSIGSGFGCISSTQLGIHYGIISLIDEAYNIKKKIAESRGLQFDSLPKIVADGGIRGYSDIIKALAVGADYVMVGSEFAKLIESAARPFIYDKTDDTYRYLTDEEWATLKEHEGVFSYFGEDNREHSTTEMYKTFYGMASRQGQIDMSGKKTKTSEGNIKTIRMNTDITKWVDNMTAYMRSAMSYLNLFDIKELNPKNVDTYLLSFNTKNSINH